MGEGADRVSVASPNLLLEANEKANMTEGSNGQAVARLEQVSKVWATGAARVTGLEKMSWEVGRGEAVALMGPSGCGKTTVLNLIGGMDRPTSGAIFVDGEDVAAMTERQLEHYRLRKIGFVFQFFHLIPTPSPIPTLQPPI